MNLIKLCLLLVGCLVSCRGDANASNYANKSLAIDSAELVANPCQQVRLAGFVCVDCSTLGFCSQVDGQWQTVSMTTCQSERGFYCSDEGTIGCTWQPKCQVPVRGKFFCQQPGIFPDPYDCRSYHECNEQNVDTPRQCTNGAAYSLLTYSCTLPRESELCSEKQYTCNHLGQMGVWATNSSYFYVCQKDKLGDQDIFYPLMMKCSAGFSFNGHICVQDSKGKAIEQAMPAQFECENGILYPADTKEGYFFCLEGHKVYQACAQGFYFDADSSLCLKEPDTCDEGMMYAAETKYGFNRCQDGKLVYERCSVGAYFDVDQLACKSEPQSQGMRSAERCEELKLYAAESEHGYLLCLNGELYHFECPDGSTFDGHSAVCKPKLQ